MISSLNCNFPQDSEYSLCEKSTELLPKLESCTLWKKGQNILIEITRPSLYIINITVNINLVSQTFQYCTALTERKMKMRLKRIVVEAVNHARVCLLKLMILCIRSWHFFNSSSKLSYNNNHLPYSSRKDRTSRKTSDSKDRLDIESKLQIP